MQINNKSMQVLYKSRFLIRVNNFTYNTLMKLVKIICGAEVLLNKISLMQSNQIEKNNKAKLN